MSRAVGTQRDAIPCKFRGLSGSVIEEMAFELSFEGRVNCSEKEEEREGHYNLRRQAKPCL